MFNENIVLTEYEIKGILGRGTFSKVKLGVNKMTKEKVAIKIIDKQFIINKNNYERIKREILILKKTNHINIIKVYDIKEDSKNYYFIMEYCKYGELFQQIINKRHLDPNISSFYFYQLINGLNYLHSHKIIHRDLKPENVLVGENNILKIIDFGLSNFSPQDEYLCTPCGSPSYAPPEMIGGDKYNGMSGDIWSCGVILYVMLNGFLPFDGNSNNDLFNKIMKCKVNYPKNMDKNAVDLLQNILVANPDKRIDMEKIKKHQFYLKGKKIFEEKYPDLINKIEYENNKEDNNLFIRYIIESDNNNNINKLNNTRLRSFENQKEKTIKEKYIHVNNINNKKSPKNESNLYKSNLILKTKNINYYKQILSDRLNIQKIRNSDKNIINKTNPDKNTINSTKNVSTAKKRNKIICTLKKKNISDNIKTMQSSEKNNENLNKKDNLIPLISKDNNNCLKHDKKECKSPNHLIKKQLMKNSQKYVEEEENINEIYGIQKETHNFNVNFTFKKTKKSKKIYNNEINNFSGENLKKNHNCTIDIEEKNKIHKEKSEKNKIYINNMNNINYNMSPIKKYASSINPKIPNNQLEEISKNNYDNYNKKYINTSSKSNNYKLGIKEQFFLYKSKYLKIQSPQELYKNNNESLFSEKSMMDNKTISTNIYNIKRAPMSEIDKINYSLRKENFNSNNKHKEKTKEIKSKNKSNKKQMLVNKLYKLSSIKKNFNTCNDILNSSKGKEDFKNYIISHNKINKSDNTHKYINSRSMNKNLNHSESKYNDKSRNKSNLKKNDNNENKNVKKIRPNSNYKSITRNLNKYNKKFNKYNTNKNILNKEDLFFSANKGRISSKEILKKNKKKST